MLQPIKQFPKLFIPIPTMNPPSFPLMRGHTDIVIEILIVIISRVFIVLKANKF